MPRPDIPTPLIGLASLWAATVLYGANIVMFILCVVVLVKKRIGNRVPWYLLGAVCLQFILSTIHIGITFGTAINALNKTQAADSTTAELIQVWLSVAGNWTDAVPIIYDINNLIGDTILIWRLYVSYGNNWLITILPIGLALSSSACTLFGSLSPLDNDVTKSILPPVVTAGLCLTAATQLLVSTLIAGRIYVASRWFYRTQGSLDQKSPYSGIMWIVVESGAALAAVDIIFLGAWRSDLGGVAQLILIMLGQLCTMVPLSIITRVALRVAFDGSTQTSGPSGNSTLHSKFVTAQGSGYTSTFDNSEMLHVSRFNGGDQESQSKVPVGLTEASSGY
jgi:hypothetical protein